MSKRKWFVLTLSLITILLLIVGCGAKEEPVSTVPEVSDPVENEEIDPAMDPTPTPTPEPEEEASAADLISDNPTADSYYYEYVVSIDGTEQVGFKIWSYDNRIRFEGGMEGESFYLDYNKGEGYLYMPADKTMIKMPMESIDNEWDSPFLMTADLDDSAVSGMKHIGDEVLDGKDCAVYEWSYAGGEYTYYIWKDEGIVIRLKVEMDGQSTYEYYFKDLIINEDFEMELEIPDDVQIMG